MTPCIIASSVQTNGYGRVSVSGAWRPAHIVAWESAHGPVPEGMELDHTCHTTAGCTETTSCAHRACMNVEHLELVTHRENLLRSPNTFAGQNARKDQCPEGHPYSGVNARGERICKVCIAAQARAYRARKREVVMA